MEEKYNFIKIKDSRVVIDLKEYLNYENNIYLDFDISPFAKEGDFLYCDLDIVDENVLEKIKEFKNKYENADRILKLILENKVLDNERLFQLKYITLHEISHYFLELEERGLIFDYSNIEGEADYYLEDANDRVIFVPADEKERESKIYETIYFYFIKAQSKEAKFWVKNTLLKIFKKDINNINQATEIQHILDYLNAFDNEEEFYSEIISEENKKMLHQIKKERERSPYLNIPDLVVKADSWMDRVNKRNKDIKEDYEGIFLVYEEDDCKWYLLASDQALQREGVCMSHCVGEGEYGIFDNIYSLRDIDNNPLATIQVSDNEVVQIKGKRNEPVEDFYHSSVQSFIRNYLNMDINKCFDIENIGIANNILMIEAQDKGSLFKVIIFKDDISDVFNEDEAGRFVIELKDTVEENIKEVERELGEYFDSDIIDYVTEKIKENWIDQDRIVSVKLLEILDKLERLSSELNLSIDFDSFREVCLGSYLYGFEKRDREGILIDFVKKVDRFTDQDFNQKILKLIKELDLDSEIFYR